MQQALTIQIYQLKLAICGHACQYGRSELRTGAVNRGAPASQGASASSVRVGMGPRAVCHMYVHACSMQYIYYVAHSEAFRWPDMTPPVISEDGVSKMCEFWKNGRLVLAGNQGPSRVATPASVLRQSAAAELGRTARSRARARARACEGGGGGGGASACVVA